MHAKVWGFIASVVAALFLLTVPAPLSRVYSLER